MATLDIKKVQAPSLTQSGYGKNIQEQFENIDDNFRILANHDFQKGDTGSSIYTKPIALTSWDKTLSLVFFTQEGKEVLASILQNVFVQLGHSDWDAHDILPTDNICSIEEVRDSINYAITITPELICLSPVNGLTIVDYFEDATNADHVVEMTGVYSYDPVIGSASDEIIGVTNSLVFRDERFVKITSDMTDENLEVYSDLIDASCTVYGTVKDNAITYSILQNFPTLYYNTDNGVKAFCWNFAGSKTGIIASGPQGVAGVSGAMYICHSDTTYTGPGAYVIDKYHNEDGSGVYFNIDATTDDILSGTNCVVFMSNSEGASLTFIGSAYHSDGKVLVYCAETNCLQSQLTAGGLTTILNNIDSTGSSNIKGLYIPYKPGSNDYVHILYATKSRDTSDYNDILHLAPSKYSALGTKPSSEDSKLVDKLSIDYKTINISGTIDSDLKLNNYKILQTDIIRSSSGSGTSFHDKAYIRGKSNSIGFLNDSGTRRATIGFDSDENLIVRANNFGTDDNPSYKKIIIDPDLYINQTLYTNNIQEYDTDLGVTIGSKTYTSKGLYTNEITEYTKGNNIIIQSNTDIKGNTSITGHLKVDKYTISNDVTLGDYTLLTGGMADTVKRNWKLNTDSKTITWNNFADSKGNKTNSITTSDTAEVIYFYSSDSTLKSGSSTNTIIIPDTNITIKPSVNATVTGTSRLSKVTFNINCYLYANLGGRVYLLDSKLVSGSHSQSTTTGNTNNYSPGNLTLKFDNNSYIYNIVTSGSAQLYMIISVGCGATYTGPRSGITFSSYETTISTSSYSPTLNQTITATSDNGDSKVLIGKGGIAVGMDRSRFASLYVYGGKLSHFKDTTGALDKVGLNNSSGVAFVIVSSNGDQFLWSCGARDLFYAIYNKYPETISTSDFTTYSNYYKVTNVNKNQNNFSIQTLNINDPLTGKIITSGTMYDSTGTQVDSAQIDRSSISTTG